MNNHSTHSVGFGRLAATLPVADMAAALRFYVDVMGFTKTFENGDPVGFVILERGDAELHLTLQPDHQPAGFNVAHLMVDDVDALHDHLLTSDVRIVKALRDHDFGLRAFVMEDPSGNRVDVGQQIS